MRFLSWYKVDEAFVNNDSSRLGSFPCCDFAGTKILVNDSIDGLTEA